MNWRNVHGAGCPVLDARALIERDAPTMDGSVVAGIVAELDGGGDDEAELCACGALLPRHA